METKSKFSDLDFTPHPDNIPFTLEELDARAKYCLLSPCKTQLFLVEKESPYTEFPNKIRLQGVRVRYSAFEKWNGEYEPALELDSEVSTPKDLIENFFPGWEIARFDSAIREILPVKKKGPAISVSSECD